MLNQSSLVWSSGGDGGFSNGNVLVTTYTPGPSDILNGTVTLTLTANATAPCVGAVADNIVITITRTPTSNAGPNATICQGSYLISGAVATHYSLLNWTTSGTGTFNYTNIIAPTYTPSVFDINTGSVTLTLTANPYDPPCATLL